MRSDCQGFVTNNILSKNVGKKKNDQLPYNDVSNIHTFEMQCTTKRMTINAVYRYVYSISSTQGRCSSWLQSGKYTQLVMFIFLPNTPQYKGQDFPRVECQYFICPTFFSWKVLSNMNSWQIQCISHLFCLQLSKLRKKVTFQNGLPLSCKTSAPLRRYLNQSKATSFIRWPTSQHLQAMSDFRVEIIKKKQDN